MITEKSKNYKLYTFIKHSEISKISIICLPEEKRFLSSNLYSDDLIIYTILVMGDPLTGKTSFCKRFAINEFCLETRTSKDIEYYLKIINVFDKNILIFIISIKQKYISQKKSNIPPEILSNINSVIVLYDLTNYLSFERVEKIIEDIKICFGDDIIIFVVGNKNDLINLREVDEEKAQNKIKELKCEYKEANCVDDDSVHNVCKELIANIYINNLDDKEKQKIMNDL